MSITEVSETPEKEALIELFTGESTDIVKLTYSIRLGNTQGLDFSQEYIDETAEHPTESLLKRLLLPNQEQDGTHNIKESDLEEGLDLKPRRVSSQEIITNPFELQTFLHSTPKFKESNPNLNAPSELNKSLMFKEKFKTVYIVKETLAKQASKVDLESIASNAFFRQ